MKAGMHCATAFAGTMGLVAGGAVAGENNSSLVPLIIRAGVA